MQRFGWLAKLFSKSPINYVVSIQIEPDGLVYKRAYREPKTLLWDDVTRIVIQTTDQGPFTDDVFFLLEAPQDTLRIPQAVANSADLLGRLQDFPGFDNEAVLQAMGCVDNGDFLCWERSPTI